MTPEQRRMRARLAANSRHHPDDALNDELRCELAESRREHQVVELLGQTPPLPRERLERIASLLLRPSTPDGSRTA